MGARAVWSLVLQDLMGVMPFHVVRHSSHLMSAEELRRRAIRAARIDDLLDHDVIQPAKFHVETYQDVAKAAIAPGGKWLLMLYEDGSIHLHLTRDLTEPPLLVIPRPDFPQPLDWNATDMNNNIIVTSMCGQYVIIVSESFNGPEYVIPL